MFRQSRVLMIWMTAFMLCAQTVFPASLSTCRCGMNGESDQPERVCCRSHAAKPVQKACCHLTQRQTENRNDEFHTAGCSCSQDEQPALPDRSQSAQESLLQHFALQPSFLLGISPAAQTTRLLSDTTVAAHHSQKYAQVLYCVSLI
ncbi:hypothetical protein [Gimesia maris]|uniref:Secreted protein n=1 Tax=Gimesia maris TaxID=122 RepID=A0ABX5YRX4_9PLAN|nr:hypothetical protein [Gimesia maris]EDL62062.1 hypothetical protein PM8797T_22423 [Gimesia maris DSM 8797]QEG18396.1 hypothetical protein GmarT_42830 [Gimesia maris]QGQ28624.1 hypothetical protein F1729_08190 [Gimesia maris]